MFPLESVAERNAANGVQPPAVMDANALRGVNALRRTYAPLEDRCLRASYEVARFLKSKMTPGIQRPEKPYTTWRLLSTELTIN